MTLKFIEEKIKKSNEWFRFHCTLFILTNGGIGFVASKYGFYLDYHLLILFGLLSCIWIFTLLKIAFEDKKIEFYINKLLEI